MKYLKIRLVATLILFLSLSLNAISQISSNRNILEPTDSVQVDSLGEYCLKGWELREIAKIISEVRISREQLELKTQIIYNYNKKILVLEPELARSYEINREMQEIINSNNIKLQKFRKGRVTYIIGGILVGALGYAILAN